MKRLRFDFTTTMGPLISAGAALLIVLGPMQPWQRTLSVAVNGSETERGFWCLVIGVAALVLAFGRAFANLQRFIYLAGTFVLGTVAMALTTWYFYDLKHTPSGEFFGYKFDVATTSSGVYISMGGAMLLLGSVLIQSFMAERPYRWPARRPDAPYEPHESADLPDEYLERSERFEAVGASADN